MWKVCSRPQINQEMCLYDENPSVIELWYETIQVQRSLLAHILDHTGASLLCIQTSLDAEAEHNQKTLESETMAKERACEESNDSLTGAD